MHGGGIFAELAAQIRGEQSESMQNSAAACRITIRAGERVVRDATEGVQPKGIAIVISGDRFGEVDGRADLLAELGSKVPGDRCVGWTAKRPERFTDFLSGDDVQHG